MTVEVDTDAEPGSAGFGRAIAAWFPLALFLITAVAPVSQPSGPDPCGLWGCPTNNYFLSWVVLIPSTPVTIGLARWARARARHVLDAFPESGEAETAATTLWVARLAVVALVAAWAWLYHVSN
jgi:hypothetical protein